MLDARLPALFLANPGNSPAKNVRSPPARYRLTIASVIGQLVLRTAASGGALFTAAAAALAPPCVLTSKYTLSRSNGAVAVREMPPASAPAKK